MLELAQSMNLNAEPLTPLIVLFIAGKNHILPFRDNKLQIYHR